MPHPTSAPPRLGLRASVATILLALFVLVGCAPNQDVLGETAKGTLTWDDLTEDEPFILLRDPLIGFDHTVIPASAENRVDTPSYTFRVEALHQSDTVPRAMLNYSELGSLKYGYARPEEGLKAPEGYVFFAADLSSEINRWDPLNIEHPGEASYLLKFPDATHAIIRPSGSVTVLFLAPKDAQPGDFVLDVVSEGVTQQLSLIDGSRSQSDIEHIYSANNVVHFTDDESVYSWAADEYGNLDYYYALIGAVEIFPYAGPRGWAPTGTTYLTVDLSIYQDFSASAGGRASMGQFPVSEASTFRLELPDGTVIEPLDVDSSIDSVSSAAQVWFEIPASLESAQFVADLQPYPRREDLAADLGMADGDLTLTTDLTFTRDDTAI